MHRRSNAVTEQVSRGSDPLTRSESTSTTRHEYVSAQSSIFKTTTAIAPDPLAPTSSDSEHGEQDAEINSNDTRENKSTSPHPEDAEAPCTPKPRSQTVLLKISAKSPVPTIMPLSSVHPAYRTPRPSSLQSRSQYAPRTGTSSPSAETSTLPPTVPAPVHLPSVPSSPAPEYASPLVDVFGSPLPRHYSSPSSVQSSACLSPILRTPPPAYVSTLSSPPAPGYSALPIGHCQGTALLSYGPAILIRLFGAKSVWDTPQSPAIFDSLGPRSCGIPRTLPLSQSPTVPSPTSKEPVARETQLVPSKSPPPSLTGPLSADPRPKTPPLHPAAGKITLTERTQKSPIRKLTPKVYSPLKKDISWPSLRRKEVERLSGLIDPHEIEPFTSNLSPSSKRNRRQDNTGTLQVTAEESGSNGDAWMIRSPSGNLLDKKQWLEREDRPLCLRERREAIVARMQEQEKKPEKQQKKRGCTAMLKHRFARRNQLSRTKDEAKAGRKRLRDGRAARRALEEKHKHESETKSGSEGGKPVLRKKKKNRKEKKMGEKIAASST